MGVFLLCIAIAKNIGRTPTAIAKAHTGIAKASISIAKKLLLLSLKLRDLNNGAAMDCSCKRTGGAQEGKAPTTEQQQEHQQ